MIGEHSMTIIEVENRNAALINKLLIEVDVSELLNGEIWRCCDGNSIRQN